METITLFLTPEFDTIRDEMGYDENDDFDAYDILFQQGYDGEMIEVEENEIFEIPEGYIATIQDEGEDVFEKEDFQTETLREGQYRYDAAENIFWKINDEPSDLSF